MEIVRSAGNPPSADHLGHRAARMRHSGADRRPRRRCATRTAFPRPAGRGRPAAALPAGALTMADARALRAHERRVAAMLEDPECTGELLLVGLAIARSVDLGDPGFTADDGTMPMQVIADRVYGQHYLSSVMVLPMRPRGDANPRRRISDVFRQDRRRYDPDVDEGSTSLMRVTCGRPMVRRDGLCDRKASTRQRLTDPATGRRQWAGCCTAPACKQW